MYDIARVQMDGGAKCNVTNNINLLKNVQWYNHWFGPKAWMKGAMSDKSSCHMLKVTCRYQLFKKENVLTFAIIISHSLHKLSYWTIICLILANSVMNIMGNQC